MSGMSLDITIQDITLNLLQPKKIVRHNDVITVVTYEQVID